MLDQELTSSSLNIPYARSRDDLLVHVHKVLHFLMATNGDQLKGLLLLCSIVRVDGDSHDDSSLPCENPYVQKKTGIQQMSLPPADPSHLLGK